ncbi:MAG: hypothetical protein HC861_02000 [Rhodospirillaceae bacterium]|nr:hypothetical protein [Rhodospirillaceae bacterium]
MSITYPNLGLIAGFALGENGWDDEMTANIRALSILVQGRVLDKQAALPGAPVDGDVVILDEHSASYREEMSAQLAQLIDGGPWGEIGDVLEVRVASPEIVATTSECRDREPPRGSSGRDGSARAVRLP